MDNNCEYSFADHILNFVGETVTIFTSSGGLSGCGFTGVVLYVNNQFVRLITSFGPAPGCPIGNGCTGVNNFNRGRSNGGCGNNVSAVGSVCDIPICQIVSFVHNAV